jgi:F-type H+-transporting ATPase subunit a
MFVRDEIARPNIGAKADKFLPFLLTIFFFIWINNLLGLLPIGANLTGNIAVTLTLALITFIVVNVNGNASYWKHILMPPVPWWLYPIMIPVELIGIFSKPFALMVRLFANITAGHIVVISLVSLIFIFKSMAIAPVSVAFALFIDVLELLVAFLQAFIFTMLTALFIGSAIEEHHHDDAHAEGAHAKHH